MLAAMPPPPSTAPRDVPVIRDGGDACPGALRLHAADDGHLARVRLPGGLLTTRQAAALADAADRHGDGHLELTSRGNVQLRGLPDACGADLARLLDAAGLLPAPTHERVRNIVATPLSGCGAAGRPDVLPWVREFDRLLCADPRAAALSGRFLFAFDDGRGDVAALDPDVTVLAGADAEVPGRGPARRNGSAPPPTGLLPAPSAGDAVRTAGPQALVRLGAAADAVAVAGADVPRAALLAAAYFLDAEAAAGTKAWRVAELPAEHALSAREFATRLTASGIDAGYVPDAARPHATPPRPGSHGGRGTEGSDASGVDDGRPRPRPAALCALIPLGRLTTAQWRTLLAVAEEGAGELRLTPWRSVVLPDAPADAPARLAAAGLVVAPGSPWETVTACTGRPGCAKSHADVRADARAVADRAAGALPVHWSGCARRCGHPRGTAWVDVVATPDGYTVTPPAHGPHAPTDSPPPHVPRAVDGPTAAERLAAAVAAARALPQTPQVP
ncbi:cobalamin biosynthesis protein CobG [Streptomyces sp. NPDC093225]|uniref:cobalamin biosynthesis protein CobG n=1 Tax=Streptomyces sp. NPDC093225 TaxID=3366034 RepID=UPI00381508FF